MKSILEFLNARKQGLLLGWKDQAEAAAIFSLDAHTIELIVLQNNLLPARYQRNWQIISTKGQLRLFRSNVAVVGCGGLGGYVIEQLGRLGIGKIIAIDPDVFAENNLNRQILSAPHNLGRSKVDVTRDRINEINPAVNITAHHTAITTKNGHKLLNEAHIVVDALDNISARLELAELCEDLNLPLVHGATAGWYGHVSTQLPGEKSIHNIHSDRVEWSGIDAEYGSLAFTTALVASLEVAEVCKIILEEGKLIRGRELCADLLDMEFSEIKL